MADLIKKSSITIEETEKVFWPGEKPEENVEAYNKSAAYYDEVIVQAHYQLPELWMTLNRLRISKLQERLSELD